jgi:hypothetical protein
MACGRAGLPRHSAATAGEQKSRKMFISDFRTLAEPADFTILV